jgi:hypothetical protein
MIAEADLEAGCIFSPLTTCLRSHQRYQHVTAKFSAIMD